MSCIVYCCKDFLIAFKEHGIPTVPLKNQSSEGTLLYEVATEEPAVLSVCGKNEWEGGAMHRLDTDTAGLVVFALSQDFYNLLSDYQNKGLFEKTYLADTDGSCKINGTVSSYFRAFGPGRKTVKAEQDISKADSNVLYSTSVKKVSKTLYECKITRGFRHQIRVHLASNGCPIKGDRLYNPQSKEPILQLTCTGVSWPGFSYKAQL